MNVFHVIGNLHKDSGGAQRIILGISKHTDKEGINNRVLYLFGDGSLSESFPKNTEINKAGKGESLINKIFSLRKLARKKNIDVLHTHSPIARICTYMSGVQRSASAVVSTVHNVYEDGYDLHWKMSEYLLLRTSDIVVTVSDKARESLDFLSTEVRAIHNGIETQRFKKEDKNKEFKNRRTWDIDSSAGIIVTVGSLREQKGHKYLIRAMDMVTEECDNVELLIVGNGPLREELQSLAENGESQNAIRFLGGRDDVAAILQEADVFAFPSLWEGFGLALLEAMYVGLPAVATNLDVFKETIGDNVTYVEPRNVHDLADKLLYILRSYEEAKEGAKEGKRLIEERFTMRACAKRYQSLYEETFYDRKER
jgi:glycosyltransferase involved in cell wall biosynthesis